MTLNVKFEETSSSFPVNLIDETESFNVNFSEVQLIDGDITEQYPGPYSVYPNFITQLLATQNKKMIADVMVAPILVQITSNPQGGNTVFIGG